MIYNRKKFKEITLEAYKKATKNLSEEQILFTPYSKKLNIDKLVPVNGKGLLDYIHRHEEECRKEHSDEDYIYYKEDGYETVIVTSSEGVKYWNEILGLNK